MKKFNFKVFRVSISFAITIVLLILHYTIGSNLIFNTVTIDLSIILPISLLTYIFVGYDLFFELIESFKEKEFFNEIFLTLIATIAAFLIGEYVEALAVIVFFQIGEYFEDYAINKSRTSIKAIMDLKPNTVRLLVNNVPEIKKPEEIKVNDVILINPGERVPLDGVILEGSSSFDYSSMNGESVPVYKKENDEILSGIINLTSPIKLIVKKEYENSTVAHILKLVENVESNKSKPEKFITKFAKIYTPIVCILALIFTIIPPLFIGINDPDVWISWIRTGASFLVISCPCALVLSVPMAYFVAIGKASKNKVLIKGSNYLELINQANTIVFDKTGTITKGNFEVTNIETNNNYSSDELIKLASYAEYHSNHPIALAIKKYKNIEIDQSLLKDYQDIPGFGVKTYYKDKVLLAGNKKLMVSNKIDFLETKNIGTNIYIAYDNVYLGCITIKDVIKETSKDAIKDMKNVGINSTYMLTGDNKLIANEIAKEANIDHVYSELLPLDKVTILEKICAESKQKVIFVGDGINDSPSLAMADIGISMGSIGSDAAIEVSNIVIMDDNLKRISFTKRLAKRTNYIVYQNIIFSIGIKVLILILSVLNSFLHFGIDSSIMWLAIFADVGVTVLCSLNSLRLLTIKIK